MTIKLNGSTAGSVALDAPASTTGNADINFKLPVADGSANQVLKTDGSGNLGWASQPASGLVLLETKEVTSGNASNSAFVFSNIFSSTYDFYVCKYDIKRTGTSGNMLIAQFGLLGNGTIDFTHTARGSMNYNELAANNQGHQYYYSTVGLHQLMGTLGSDANAGFRGTMDIIQPQSNMLTIVNHGVMHYGATNQRWLENSASASDTGITSMTCFKIAFANGNTTGGNLTSTVGVDVYGTVSMFGVRK